MANISSGYLFIKFHKNQNVDTKVVNEIISKIENNNHFTYGGTSEGIYDEKSKSLDLSFNGRWSCDTCWDWFMKEMSEASKDKELSEAAQNLLITSIFNGGSHEYGSQYRDKVEKANGERKLKKFIHVFLDEQWPEILDLSYIKAFDLNNKESITYGNDVEIQLLDKSENLFLFKVLGGVGGCLLLIHKEKEEVLYFSDIEDVESESIKIKELIEGIENGEIEQQEDLEDWYGTNELIDDLIGHIEELYDLVEEE
tara:strand:- start:747 stop:1511 length:765 start_codon:yes stop_codon:yes gene_type:complete